MKPLTKEQLRDNAAAMLAFADGKPFELFTQGGWSESLLTTGDARLLLECMSQGNHYRAKPQPVSRPWSKPEDVPLNCWLNAPSVNNQAWLVNGVIESGVYSAGGLKTWSELRDYQHSTDRKTWKPCTVEEQP
jgi:hypothetical protein